jgi:hypothetical protein
MADSISYLIPTQFQESIIHPINTSKYRLIRQAKCRTLFSQITLAGKGGLWKWATIILTPTYPCSYLYIDDVSLSGVNVKSVSRAASGPAAKDAGGNTGHGQVRCLPRDGILERHFQSRFLGINSSLLRIECFSGFLSSFFRSTKCYSWIDLSFLVSWIFCDDF